MRLLDELFPLVEGFYVDLHKNPELSHAEHRTASGVAEWLNRTGYEVHTGVGGTGVVGLLRNGPGPTVMLRADMDALPLAERTGLPYASTAREVGDDGAEVPVMHACGHDAHTACLVGAADLLSETREEWSGTVMVVAQPGEETTDGAKRMLDDGLFERFGRPDVILAQNLGPQPAGLISHRSGVVMGATRSYRVRVFGEGGHAAMPHTAIDPVLIAAHIVTRLQGVVAREISPGEMAVLTVGRIRAGARANVIPDEAYLEINTRAINEGVIAQLEEALGRMVRAEAAASGATREPVVEAFRGVGITRNDPESTEAVSAAHLAYFGEDYVIHLPDPSPGSEDIGLFGLPDDPQPIPYVLWFVGATPHDVWEAAPGSTPYEKMANVPSPHSPFFAPAREPTLRAGLAAITVAALSYLGSDKPASFGGTDARSHELLASDTPDPLSPSAAEGLAPTGGAVPGPPPAESPGRFPDSAPSRPDGGSYESDAYDSAFLSSWSDPAPEDRPGGAWDEEWPSERKADGEEATLSADLSPYLDDDLPLGPPPPQEPPSGPAFSGPPPESGSDEDRPGPGHGR